MIAASTMTRRTLLRLAAMTCALLLPLVACAQSPAPGAMPVEGEDYERIDGGTPWQPLGGKVEVVEVFAYSCGHCNDFAPKLSAWKGRQPADVRVTYLPAVFNLDDPYARATFAAQQMGVLDKTHAALFRAIHGEGAMPPRNPTVDELATFYAAQGVDAGKFRTAFASPQVDAQMKAANAFAVASKVQGTPTLVVNGRYRIKTASHEDMLRVADALIAMERKAGTRGAAAKPGQ